jgi:hypothetical protein
VSSQFAQGSSIVIGGIVFAITYNVGGTDVVLTASAVSNPIFVYVDDSWAGTAPNTDPANDPIGGLVFGFNAFADIQSGLDQVAANGTLVVFGGTYAAPVNFNKPLPQIQIDTNLTTPAQAVVNENGAGTLSADTLFSLQNATGLTFGSTIDGGSNLSFGGNGALVFGQPVGSTTPVASITTSSLGSTAINGGSIKTSGAQIYNNATTLGGATTLTAGGSISEMASGSISGGSLTTISTGGTVLNGGNAIGAFTATNNLGAVQLTDTAAPLTVISITENGAGQVAVTNRGNMSIAGPIAAGGGNVLLTSTGTVTQTTAATSVTTTGRLTITAPNGVGTSGQPFVMNVGQLVANSAGTNGNQFLSDTATTTLQVPGALNAGAGTINLVGGTFQVQSGAAGDAVADASTLAVRTNAIFDLNGMNETLGALSDGGVAGGTVKLNGGTLTLGVSGSSTFSGAITDGTTTGGGIVKTGATTFTASGTNNYTGTTVINIGTFNLPGMLNVPNSFAGTPGYVLLSGNNAALTGGGTGQINGRGVIVTAGITGVTVQGITVMNGSTGVGVLLNSGSSARLLNNTVSGNFIGVDVNGGTAYLQNDVLSFNIGLGSFTDGVSAAAGLRARNGGVVDAGQKGGGFDFTNLNGGGALQGSTGGNTFVGYTPTTGSAVPTTPQAILDLNVDNVPGARGEPFDLMAQNNSFGDNGGHTYGPQSPGAGSNFTNIENLVFHDVDNALYGFINYVTPLTVTPTLVTGLQIYNRDPNADPTFTQRSMIAHIQLGFDNFVILPNGALSITKLPPQNGVNITTASSYTGAIGTTVTQEVFDVTTGEFRVVIGFTGANGLEVSGSLEDGQYTVNLDGSKIQAFIAAPPTQQLQYNGGSISNLHLWRLFGDVHGLGYIDSYDQLQFQTAYRSRRGMANYRDYFDYANDGTVGAAAFYQFMRRSGAYTPTNSLAF